MGGRSGLSENMQVGTLASLALDGSVAMRVRFEGAVPEQRHLYFRGPVLTSYDGRDWKPLRAPLPARLQAAGTLRVTGTPVAYEVTLEGNNHPWLPVLDATPEAPALAGYSVSMGPDLQWTADRPMGELVRFKVRSYPQFRYGPEARVPALQDMLNLPAGFNPRTRQWAREIRADARYAQADTATLIAMVMDQLHTGGYRYTLEPGVFGNHTADEFWFDRKAGFCEHIASSFVLLMRALDIPARVVTGYQGGELNGVDGLWTVRQSDAHAWAEVWMVGQGWVRVDPTSAVAPGRTGSLERLIPPRSVIAQALSSISPGFEINLRALWDATNDRWNQWVLNYSQAKQLDMLRNIGFNAPSWEDLSYLLLGVIVAASLAGAAWTQWERMRQDPWLRLVQGADRKLRGAGLPLNENAPPRHMATVLARYAGGTQPAEDLARIHDWLLRLEAWRYAPPAAAGSSPRAARAALGTLQREFRQLRWPQALPPHPTTL
jgi:transglutaminase-like putative cysteine protease